MSLLAGTVMKLLVRREVSPYGWFLGESTDAAAEVLLPYGEAVNESFREGDEAEVFLFHDDKERLTATTRKPLLTAGQMGRLEVVDFHPRFGYFLEIGIGRQLLLPLKELPPDQRDVWPQKGDFLHVVMRHDKSGRMLARLAKMVDLEPHIVRAPASWNNEWKEGWVTDAFRDGVFVLVDGGVLGYGALGYIHHSAMVHPLRIGQQFKARVTQVREDGRVSLSIRAAKETGRLEDADRLLQFLKDRPGGAMPYSDQTNAEDIKRRFGLSKSAFKRALGKLMKEGLIVQKGSWTHLANAEELIQASEDGQDKPQ